MSLLQFNNIFFLVMLIVPHSTRYWHRRACPPIHQVGRVDNIHGQARQNFTVKRDARRTRPLVWTGLNGLMIRTWYSCSQPLYFSQVSYIAFCELGWNPQ